MSIFKHGIQKCVCNTITTMQSTHSHGKELEENINKQNRMGNIIFVILVFWISLNVVIALFTQWKLLKLKLVKCTPKNEILSINITKYVQELYEEIYKTLMK